MGLLQSQMKKMHCFHFGTDVISMVISWILNSTSKEIGANILFFFPTTHEMWTIQEDRYSQSNGPRIFEVQRDLYLKTQGNLSVTVYFTPIDILWHVLHQYLPPIMCSCGVMKGA